MDQQLLPMPKRVTVRPGFLEKREILTPVPDGCLPSCPPDPVDCLAAMGACDALLARLPDGTWPGGDFREEAEMAAREIRLMAAIFAGLQGKTAALPEPVEAFLADCRRLWLQKNKPSELAEIERMFRVLAEAAGA